MKREFGLFEVCTPQRVYLMHVHLSPVIVCNNVCTPQPPAIFGRINYYNPLAVRVHFPVPDSDALNGFKNLIFPGHCTSIPEIQGLIQAILDTDYQYVVLRFLMADK